MSGFELIARGIATDDMDLVKAGYKLLTNTDVQVNKRVSKDEGVTTTGINRNSKMGIRGTQVKASGVNQFYDAGEKNPKLKDKTPPVDKTKRKSTLILAKCKECGKKEKIDNSLLNVLDDDSYTCNGCIISKIKKM